MQMEISCTVVPEIEAGGTRNYMSEMVHLSASCMHVYFNIWVVLKAPVYAHTLEASIITFLFQAEMKYSGGDALGAVLDSRISGLVTNARVSEQDTTDLRLHATKRLSQDVSGRQLTRYLLG
jgi:hypothetical protein